MHTVMVFQRAEIEASPRKKLNSHSLDNRQWLVRTLNAAFTSFCQ